MTTGIAGILFAVCLAGIGYWLGLLHGVLPAAVCIIAGAMLVTKRKWAAGFAAAFVLIVLALAGQVLPLHALPF